MAASFLSPPSIHPGYLILYLAVLKFALIYVYTERTVLLKYLKI